MEKIRTGSKLDGRRIYAAAALLLFIYYMLKQVNFPLTNAQLTDFFLQHEYASYFTLQQALSELQDSGLIQAESTHNTTRYVITREGEDTLGFFEKDIPPAITEDMDSYLKENRFRMREAAGTVADYYKSTNQDYVVHCEVREGRTTLIGLDISVPDKDQAVLMCSHWNERSQDIYAYVMKTLMSSGK